MFPGGWLRSPTYARAWTPAPGFADRWNREMANALRPRPRPGRRSRGDNRRIHASADARRRVGGLARGDTELVVSLASRMVAVDLAYHVRVGEEILAAGDPARQHPFVRDCGSPWLDQQWLAQVFIAIAHRGGFATVALLRACAHRAVVRARLPGCRAKGASPRASSLLSLSGFIVCLQTLAMRPQLLRVLLFSACLWILAARHDPSQAAVGAAGDRRGVGQRARELRVRPAARRRSRWSKDAIGGDPGRRRIALFAGLHRVATSGQPLRRPACGAT